MPTEPEPTPIEVVAAAWVVERDEGFTPERERAFDRWLLADERHAAAFLALAETWERVADLQLASRPLEPRSSREFATPPPHPRRPRVAWFPVSLAAAALAIGWAGWSYALRPTAGAVSSPFTLAAATEVGAWRKVVLPDGSTLQLNTDTAISVRYDQAGRHVRLERGEASFSVAKEASRPFVVTAAGVRLRVTGTVFNVRLQAKAVDVVVTEGAVRVSASPATSEAGPSSQQDLGAVSAATELGAGQKVSVPLQAAGPMAAPVPVAASAAEIRQALAWHAKKLEFDATPLSEVVAQINRYNRHQLRVDDVALGARHFGGSIPADRSETFVSMLEADFEVEAERQGDVTVLRLKSQPSARQPDAP